MANDRDDLLKTIGYSQDAIDLINNEVNVGEIKNPSVTMKYQSPVCGDIMVIHLKIEENQDDKNKILPPLAEGDVVKLKDILCDQHFTEPPPRYSEASLVKAL